MEQTILSCTLGSPVLLAPEHDPVHCCGVLAPIPLSGVTTSHGRVRVAKPVLHADLGTPGVGWRLSVEVMQVVEG